MAVITFRAADLRRVVEHAMASTKFRRTYNDQFAGIEEVTEPMLWLVGDRGVYLMSNGDPGDKTGVGDSLYVVFAEKISPKDEGWYDTKRLVFGGDDFVESLPWCETIKAMIDAGQEYIRMKIVGDNIELLDVPA